MSDDMEFEQETDEVSDETNNDKIEIAAEPVAGPRKRGRKKGVKVGPRPAVWVCAGIVNDECVLDRFSAPPGSNFDQLESFSSDDASKAFEDMYDVAPDSVIGPFHDKKGGQTGAAKKRETITMTDAPTLTLKRENAIYKGWKGIAYGIEGRDDVVYFMYNNEINPNPDKKKSPPSAKTIIRTAIEFVEPTQINA